MEAILDIAVFCDEPDEGECRMLENGLRKMAENGNRTAVFIYAMVTTYNNNCYTFSEETALELLIKNDGFEDYKKFLEKNFNGSKDAEYFGNAPVFWYSAAIVKAE